MDKKLLEKYAYLLVRTGLDVQPGQKVIIEAPVETYEFARIVSREAYNQQAGEVVIHYTDAYQDKLRAIYEDPTDVSRVRQWEKDSLSEYLEEGACSLLFTSPNPHLMDDLSENRAHAISTHTNDKRNIIRNAIASKNIQWCIAAVPNLEWAKTVMKDVPEDQVLDAFWQQILDLVYVDNVHDPVATWKERQIQKGELQQKLTDLHLDSVHMTSSNGTDVTFGFHEDCSFGHRYVQKSGPDNVCNIPTEEICTSPDKWRTNGKVVSSRPLLIGGKIIDEFEVTFKDGKAINCKAKIGEELLRSTINTDEGSCYIGEFALVPYHSPISQSGYVYYNTLIDENAACHIALGNGFAGSVGLDSSKPETWASKNLNHSKIHVDFMIGYKDTKIVGYTKDGKEVLIFENGDFAL